MARASLLLSLSSEDAEIVRRKAAYDDRTISSYVLRIVRKQIAVDNQLAQQGNRLVTFCQPLPRGIGVRGRAILHIRCTDNQAAAIRLAARRRGISTSAFTVRCLERWWRGLASQPFKGSRRLAELEKCSFSFRRSRNS